MKVSVVIPTLNGSESLGELIARLWDQDSRPCEIIVIDSSSEDGTAGLAGRLGARTIVIPRESFNHGRTRNIAAAEATGDILMFMTQDALPLSSSLIRSLIAPLAQPEIAAAYGRHIPKPDATPLERFARTFNYPDEPSIRSIQDLPRLGIKTFFFSDACSAVKKDLFLEVGMFPEDIPANEDMLLAARIIVSGRRIAYAPDAAVVHSHSLSLGAAFRRYYRIALSLRRHRWVLSYAKPEHEGVRFLLEQLRFVLDGRQYRWLPYLFLESLAKYSGYRLGLLAG